MEQSRVSADFEKSKELATLGQHSCLVTIKQSAVVVLQLPLFEAACRVQFPHSSPLPVVYHLAHIYCTCLAL